MGGFIPRFQFPVCYDSHQYSEWRQSYFLNVRNPGALPVPFTAKLRSSGIVVNPAIRNSVTGEHIGFDTTLNKGDVLEIYRTTTDRLAVKLISGGVETNAFALLDEDSDLMELHPGDNVLTADAASGREGLQASISFTCWRWASCRRLWYDIRRLDETTLARLGNIDVWVSVYWDEPYNSEGSFTLEVRPTPENLELLREGRWLVRTDAVTKVPMRICHRSNENEDANLVVTGYPATWIFTKRVSVAAVKNENAETAMLALAKAAAPWPKLEVAEPKGFDTTFEQQTSGNTLFDYFKTVGAACDLGFRVVLMGKNSAKKLMFEVWRPTADPNNRFSTKWGSLREASWPSATAAYANVAPRAGGRARAKSGPWSGQATPRLKERSAGR